MRRAIAATLALVLSVSPAAAHKLKVFATAIGDEVQGRVYFVGGGAAIGVPVSLRDSAEAVVATTTTAAPEGTFTLPLDTSDTLTITADAQDGHVATFTLRAASLAETSTVPATTTASPQPAPAVDAAALETAIARQLAPLADEIDELRDSIGLRDIIGGLGYLVGAFGLWAFYLARRRK